jgi:hypothetical protein
MMTKSHANAPALHPMTNRPLVPTVLTLDADAMALDNDDVGTGGGMSFSFSLSIFTHSFFID